MKSFRSIAAFAAIAVAPVLAWYPELPTCPKSFTPFTYTGCYDNGSPGEPYALEQKMDLDRETGTPQKCQALCKGNGFRMSGLGYYGECYCGNSIRNDKLSEDKCVFKCNGDSNQICGGDDAVSIYTDPTFNPISSVSVSDYQYVGCWTDDAQAPLGKAVFYKQDQLDGDSLTNEKCLATCLAGGYPYAGTEWSRECYCGVTVGDGTALTDESQCSKKCTGDDSQTCGGDARLSLYVAKGLLSKEPCGKPPVLPSTSTSSSSSTMSSTSSTSSVASTTSSATITSVTPTTTGPAQCTATIITPPKCEYGCGNWCAGPLPDFSDKTKCLQAWSSCKLQIASCFLKAGWPNAMDCFNYAGWCGKIKDYCFSDSGRGGKNGCYKQYPPIGGQQPSTSTSVYPCPTTASATTTTKTSTTSTCNIPTPTGICKQPTDNRWGYGPGKPVGGIELPLVTCNNVERDYRSGNVYKLYTDNDSSKCRSYVRKDCKPACEDACKWQYKQCLDVYVEACKTNGKFGNSWYGGGYNPNKGYRAGGRSPRSSRAEEMEMIRRTTNQFSQNYNDARDACKAQYQDCRNENYNVKDNGQCKTYAGDWVQ
ncbi:WSC domain-domain-containing protein [Microdochium bolleyi]|uniref:WSC domain-domain-containing protein n=1 Tax=Microdochium bolleyi TaxID=196109 RepID=A0A136JK94_9PEZI|nr:WSC domain-domain-containing protein [Microdochium bolleyi]